MKIENLSKDVAELKKMEVNYVIDYGSKKQGDETKVEFEIDFEGELRFVKSNTSCGTCTKSNIEQKGDKYILTISYDSNVLGIINKSVYINYQYLTERRQEPTKIITLKGNVTK